MPKRRAKKMMGQYVSETWYVHNQGYRRCTTCGKDKFFPEGYHRNGTGEDGEAAYRLECKECYNAKRKENKVSNKHAEFVGHQKHRGEDAINYSYSEWLECVIFFGGNCAYCGRSMRKGETLTRDHMVPWSEGGRTTADNVIPACPSCNSSKGKRELKEWYLAQPFFSQDRLNRIFQWRAIIRSAGGGTSNE